MNCYRVPVRNRAGSMLSIIVAGRDPLEAVTRAEVLAMDLFRRKPAPWSMQRGIGRPEAGDPVHPGGVVGAPVLKCLDGSHH